MSDYRTISITIHVRVGVSEDTALTEGILEPIRELLDDVDSLEPLCTRLVELIEAPDLGLSFEGLSVSALALGDDE